MENPKVSIIINCFNGEQTLRQAIDSVYAQTYKRWEIILWDNGSTDSTEIIAKSFDHKLKYFKSQETTTLSLARKKACLVAEGEWIAFLDADDYWYENKLDEQIDKVNGTDYILCYAGIDEIDEDGNFIRSWVSSYQDGNQFSDQLNQFDINMVTPIVNRKKMKQHNITFDEQIIASEEYNFFLKLAAVGDFCHVPKPLGVWRINNSSLTNNSINVWSKDRRRTLDYLQEKYPSKYKKYKKDFDKAYATADYYKARFLFSSSDWNEGRRVMKKISHIGIRYFFLMVISYFPPLWNLLHKEKIKRNLAAIFLGSVKLYKRK